MKKYIEGYLKGLSIGLGFLTILGITGIAYGAYVSISNVNTNDTLTASTFNQVLENIDSIKTIVDGHTTSISSLNTTIDGNSSSISSLNTTVSGHTTTLSGLSAIPVGAIIAFNGSTCPTGWTAADGSGDEKNTSGVNTTLDLRGEFIRGLDSGRGVDTGRTLSSYQAQDWKGFYQHNTGQNTYTYSHSPVYMGKSTSSYIGNLFVGGWATPSAAMGTMWDSSEIRPRNVALLYCVKQ